MKKNGFTLAEVLITLGVIGIVASLTMPNLSSNYQTTACETATAKAYVTVQEAAQRYMTREGVESLDDLNFSANDFINQNFKIAKTCTNENASSNCLANSYRRFNNNSSSFSGNSQGNGNFFTLTDGTVINVSDDRNVVIDVNGLKGPNRVGFDYWVLSLAADGSLRDRDGASTTDIDTLKSYLNTCKTGAYSGCFNSFVANGFKFDY